MLKYCLTSSRRYLTKLATRHSDIAEWGVKQSCSTCSFTSLFSRTDDEDAASDAADFSDEAMDQLGDGDMFENEETKSRFTQYSMTSSVIRRTEGLTLLDDRFEKVEYPNSSWI